MQRGAVRLGIEDVTIGESQNTILLSTSAIRCDRLVSQSGSGYIIMILVCSTR